MKQLWIVTLECGYEAKVRAEDEDDLPVWGTCPVHNKTESIVDFREAE